MKRKLTSLLMALVMTLSLAVPAFANSGEAFYTLDGTASSEKEQTMTFNVKTRVPVISLTLPNISQTDAVVFNPYRIEYSVDGSDTLNGVQVTDQNDRVKQVISPVYAIQNLSDAQLTVGVKATTTVPDTSKILLITTGTPDATKKQAKIDVTFITTTDAAGESDVVKTNSSEQDIEDIWTNLGTTKQGTKQSFTLDPKKAAEIKANDTDTSKRLILEKTAGGEEASAANYLAFQFSGEASDNLTNDAWTAADTFTTVLAFTFVPGYTAPASTVTADATVTLAAADSNKTVAIDALDVSGTIADQTIAITLPSGAEGLVLDSTANASSFQVTPTGGSAAAVGISLTDTTITITGSALKTALTQASATAGTGNIVIKYKSDSTQATPDKTVTLTVNFTNVAGN